MNNIKDEYLDKYQGEVEIKVVCDNLGKTRDRFSIFVDYKRYCYLITTNEVASIWSFDESPSYEELKEDNEYLGEKIEWSDLPYNLRKTIVGYFEQ